MANELRFVDGNLLFVGGNLAMSNDCCCGDACTATTPQELLEYIRDDLGLQPQSTVGPGDYTMACDAGDCTSLEGAYTLPYASLNNSTGDWVLRWDDIFNATSCGVSRNHFVISELRVLKPGLVFVCFLDFFINAVPSIEAVSMAWRHSFSGTCEEVIEHFTQIQDLAERNPSFSGGAKCATSLGGPGIVTSQLI